LTFYDLVHSLTDADVYEALYDHATEIELKENNPWAGLDEDSCYRNKQEYIEYHFYAWQQLKELEPIPSDLVLCVNWIDETKDEKLIAELAEYGGEPEQGYEVLGYSTTGEGFYDCNTFGDYFSENPTAPYYAIEFRPWENGLV
jgi:hypothetical protein